MGLKMDNTELKQEQRRKISLADKFFLIVLTLLKMDFQVRFFRINFDFLICPY